jgi:putative AbiEii toxin of type IV toxin-antitoxin system
MTPKARQDLEANSRAQDSQPKARYQDWNPVGRTNMAIYDLIDADTMQERKIAALVREGSIDEAQKKAKSPSPLQVINELMRLSNLPIEITVEEGQKIVARKNGGNPYSVAELSDGERNAFLMAADVLTAKSGTLLIIDEPERHLHRAIISPLLKLLFERRSDCAFIVSTHELGLPVDTPKASTLLIRGCEYQGNTVQSWAADVLPPETPIDDDLKADILGSRKKIIFVEGTAYSLDTPLYSLLFPQVSVVAKASCRDVENAVRGLRSAPDMHWVSTWGIVDNDQRSTEDVERLKKAGIWALTHYSVESLYFHELIITKLAMRQAALISANPDELSSSAINDAIAAAKSQKFHLVNGTVLRAARQAVFENLPPKSEILEADEVKVELDIAAMRKAENDRFDELIDTDNWDGLLTKYPLRESSAFDRVVDGLKVKDGSTYKAMVLKLLQDDSSALSEIRNLLGDLYTNVNA